MDLFDSKNQFKSCIFCKKEWKIIKIWFHQRSCQLVKFSWIGLMGYIRGLGKQINWKNIQSFYNKKVKNEFWTFVSVLVINLNFECNMDWGSIHDLNCSINWYRINWKNWKWKNGIKKLEWICFYCIWPLTYNWMIEGLCPKWRNILEIVE